MNGTYFQNPAFPTNGLNLANAPIGGGAGEIEQSFIENILRQNKGKRIKAYFSFPDSTEWRNKIYEGIIEESGRDHLIINDNKTGKWYLILLIYLNYVEFDEPINYSTTFVDPNS